MSLSPPSQPHLPRVDCPPKITVTSATLTQTRKKGRRQVREKQVCAEQAADPKSSPGSSSSRSPPASWTASWWWSFWHSLSQTAWIVPQASSQMAGPAISPHHPTSPSLRAQTPSPFFCLLIILQAKSEVTSRRSNSTAETTGRSTLRLRTLPPPRSPLSPLSPLSPTGLEGAGRRHMYPGLCLSSPELNPNHLVAEAGPTPYGLQNSGFQSGDSHSGFPSKPVSRSLTRTVQPKA